jgi:biopolymer transport protein ExbD
VRNEPLIITVKKDGSYFLANTTVSEKELGAKLQAILAGLDDKGVFLRADKNANYGSVVKALAAARIAGATKLGMVTEPEP